jgi:hypothetical protein
MKVIVFAIFFALFATGCSHPKVEILFHNSPSDSDKIVSDVKMLLANHGMRAWSHKWIDPKRLSLQVDTDKNSEQYKESISKVFEPMLWKSRNTSELIIQITEKSKRVLKLLELQEGQLFKVTLNWDDADFGVFGIRSDSRGQGYARNIYNCSVRVPVVGNIPNLTYRYTIDSTAEAQNTQSSSGFVKFFQTVNELNPSASHTITLSDYDEDEEPWSKIEFANRTYSRPRVPLDGQEISSNEGNLKDALFVFAPCTGSNQDSLLLGKDAFIASPCREFTNETCAQKIKELTKGDFYGVTGYEVAGNVEKYQTTW